MDETKSATYASADMPLPSNYFALDRARQRVVEAVADIPLSTGERGFISWGLCLWDVPTLEHFEQLVHRCRNHPL